MKTIRKYHPTKEASDFYANVRSKVRKSSQMAYTAAASARAWGRIEEPLQERICGMIDNCVSSLHFPEKGLTKTEIIEILMNDCIDTYGYNLDPKAAKVFRKIPKHCGVFLLENVILKT